MTSISSTALAGITRAFERLDRSADKLIKGTSGLSQDDPAESIIGMSEAKAQAKASIAVLRAEDEMRQRLLDVTA